MYEQLKQIRAAEESAAQRLEQAKQREKAMLSDAQAQAQRLINQRAQDAQNEAQALRDRASAETREALEKRRQADLSEAQQFAAQRAEKLPGAVQLICGKVTGL